MSYVFMLGARLRFDKSYRATILFTIIYFVFIDSSWTA